MADKNICFTSSKDNQNYFDGAYFNSVNAHYTNLNLNGNFECRKTSSVHSKNILVNGDQKSRNQGKIRVAVFN